MEEWEKAALAEVREEWVETQHPTLEGVSLKEFVSKSNGKGRKRRKRLREVILVTIRNRTYQIGKKLTRNLEFLLKDIFPEPDGIISDGDWIDEFLRALRGQKSNKKRKR